MSAFSNDQIHQAVQEHYQDIVQADPAQPCSCQPAATSRQDGPSLIYPDLDLSSLPSEVTDISLGCGDPITLAELKPGQTVLDLGSGGGIDCFLAAERVGPQGTVIGVDMTQAMIDRAENTRIRLGAENIDFRLGQIESLPVDDQTVDVILSNCVINLSPDKPAVFSEAYRVLKPGGKLAVSDISTDGSLPEQLKEGLGSWAGCLAGAWDIKDYQQALEQAGFTKIRIEKQPWGEDIFDAALDSLNPELRKQVQENKENNRQSLVFNDGGGMKVVKLDRKLNEPKVEIFSARISAYKPL